MTKPATDGLLTLWKNRRYRRARHQFIEEVTPIIYNALRRSLMPPGTTLQDVAGETIAYLLANLDQYNPRRSTIGVYIRRITSWNLKEIRRKNGKSALLELPEGHDVPDVRSIAQAQDASHDELIIHITSILDPTESTVLLQTTLHGVPLEVVARSLGISPSKCRAIRWAAISKLRACPSIAQFKN